MPAYTPGEFTTHETPPAPSEPGLYHLSEKRQIIERRGGAVFKTKFIEYTWRKMDARYSEGDFVYCSLSTNVTKGYLNKGISLLITVRNK